jgi:hypothetical protein
VPHFSQNLVDASFSASQREQTISRTSVCGSTTYVLRLGTRPSGRASTTKCEFAVRNETPKLTGMDARASE